MAAVETKPNSSWMFIINSDEHWICAIAPMFAAIVFPSISEILCDSSSWRSDLVPTKILGTSWQFVETYKKKEILFWSKSKDSIKFFVTTKCYAVYFLTHLIQKLCLLVLLCLSIAGSLKKCSHSEFARTHVSGFICIYSY